MPYLSRRTVLKGSGLIGLAALLPADFIEGCASAAGASGGLRVLDAHQAAVVRAATARLIPGPQDDSIERGHPGAREANVTRYIDTMLGALSVSPAEVYADGPFSNRAGNPTDDMATFIGLTAAQKVGWSERLAGLRRQYERGVADLDRLAGGDFAAATPQTQDAVLGKNPKGFTQLLLTHAIEGMYSAPEYGGNANLVGWEEIKFPGDRQPTGYTDREVSDSDGPDVYVPSGVGQQLLKLIQSS
ncbi:MAG: gluconate 2-dehydrogenase subunit 3 family protein [Acidimicrobiales bacterium]